MPLPAGFKVNGGKASTSNFHIPPRTRKIMDILNAVPFGELLTTMELSTRLQSSLAGNYTNQPSLVDYREKVDNKLFWGNRKSIAQLRKQLITPEENQ